MTAQILNFPARRSGGGVSRLEPGDLLVTCFNAALGLWCAWPVHSVDRDGVPMGVRLRNGDLMAADRVNARGEALGFRRGNHPATAFEALYWKTWDSADAAMAEIVAGVVS